MIARLVVAIALAAAVVSLAGPARAGDDPTVDDPATVRAKKLYREGDKLFNLGKFAEALDKFEKAYEAKPIPGFLFNIGQCHRNLDEYDAAIFSFRKYLKLAPDATNRDAVLVYIDELEHEKQKATASDLDLVKPDPDDGHGHVDVVPHKGRPFYKKWWFWGGVAVVGAGAAGTAYVLTSGGGPPGTDLGNIDFGK